MKQIIFAISFIFILSGCGLKKGLYLPDSSERDNFLNVK